MIIMLCTVKCSVSYQKNTLGCLTKGFGLQEKPDIGKKSHMEGMGTPEIKYGDSVCFVQHVKSGLWLTYQAIDTKSSRVGVTQRKVNL